MPSTFVDESGHEYCARSEIGRGVLTTVIAAEAVGAEPASPPEVAIKTILPLWLGHPMAEARIAREREISEALWRGPEAPRACARILGGGRQLMPDGRSRPFHVMPLYAGVTLAERLKQTTGRTATPPLPAPAQVASVLSVLSWGADILGALAHLHSAGWVHRDLKPQNILLIREREGERAALIDYGLAVRVGSAGHDGDEPFGTPAYVSPEVVAGAPLDARADLYSLGLVLFELLCARRPFPTRDPIELLEAHLSATPPRLRSLRPDLSVELEAVIGATLSKSPGDRPADAGELAAALCSVPEAAAGGALRR